MKSGWTISTREEVIAALWFIVALQAYVAGFRIAAFFFTIKATIDMIGSIYFAIMKPEDEK